MDRREFLKGMGGGTIAAALAGCGPQESSHAQRATAKNTPASAPTNDLEALLADQHFITRRGGRYELVTLADLRNQLQSKPTILNFGYGLCSQYCSLSAPVLARFSDRANIVSINVRPQSEVFEITPGQDATRDTEHRSMLSAAGVKDPIVLYPTDAQGNYLNDAQIYSIQKRLGQLIDAKRDPENLPGIIFNGSAVVENGHTEQAVMFDRCGQIKAQAKVTEFGNMDKYIGTELAAASQASCPAR